MMTGYDSSDDSSPQTIAMLVLATFSTSYNFPVYLRYNLTYRRTFLRMLRCQAGAGKHSDVAQSVSIVRQQNVGSTAKTTFAGDGGKVTNEEQRVNRQATPGCQPQEDNELEPSTSQDRRLSLAVEWARHANTQQADAPDSSVIIHRY